MRTPVKLWSLVAVGLAILAASLQAEFLYMVNGNSIAAYLLWPLASRLAKRTSFWDGVNPNAIPGNC